MSALPPPPLNLQPLGLLDFFGIKNGGQYPRQLISALQPTIDLWDHYVETNLRRYQVTFADLLVNTAVTDIPFPPAAVLPTPLPNNGTNIIVPDNELWYIPHWNVSWRITDAAGRADFGLIFDLTGGATISYRIGMDPVAGYTAGLAGISVGGQREIAMPVWLPPGAILRLRIFGVLVGAGLVEISSRISLVRMLL